ncbi:hypothetical protein Trydic_g17447 [Trypoxylus dichotomus]
MTRIGDIGIGIFILIILWIATLIILVHSIRAQNNVGWISLAISTCITITLVIIPTDSKEKEYKEYDQNNDYTFIYKTALLTLLTISAILAQCLKACLRPNLLQRSLDFSNSPSRNKLIYIKDHDDFLNKVMKSDIPVVINFHANWCEPCHILTPKLQELVGDKEDIDLVTVDVELHAELVHTFEVKAVPAVLAVKNRLVIDKSIGLIDANTLEKLLENLTSK